MTANIHLHAASMPAKLASILSALLFWCLPFAPFLSIIALRTTRNTAGWPRILANSAAVLTIAWTIFLTILLSQMIFILIWNSSSV